MNDAAREDGWEAVKAASDEELWEHCELPECRAELERRRTSKPRQMYIRVEASEDIRNYSAGISIKRGGYIIAKKGRKGWIDELDAQKGIGEKVSLDFVDVLFDGNKIRRSVPNRSLRMCEEK